MIRISGVNIPEKLRIDYALTLVYGVGPGRAIEILKETKLDVTRRTHELTDEEVRKIQMYIDEHFKVEGNLRSEVNENIKRLREIHCYRGLRHIRGLPTRGQRTRSNARTRKGKKHTVGALTKEAWAKVDQVTPEKGAPAPTQK
ncbi:30S ribosomal protein S13 [Candidatus Roizmanbacteria bacterium CG10_big_fil_rev_8_21_14_0_10_45_7]|uniref:Small ribosomal subunit protein uS13 n=1 Tax=Candidatus Roizmanbacteria bacterium CG10_big_fil_rev_8_21_14_0_10_45_7 TaxID=1974854 RepID=A0A2M8KU92_9BACT|nr:MAG: 30S ribosomal protein S13 [Candidatus Roizmanbacteria bacterium CG10_big_fil_rev_8_21_14_0_10_45_7]